MQTALRWMSQVMNRTGALVILPVLTLLVTVDVVLRYAFNAPLAWALEAAQHLLLLYFLCGLVESFRNGAHVRMELIAEHLPISARRATSVVYAGLIVIVFSLLALKAADDIPFFYTLPEVTEKLHLPVWVFYALMVLAAIGVILYAIVSAVSVLRGERVELEEVHGEGHE